MRSGTIKFKLIGGILFCLTLAALVILLLLNYSYKNNIKILGEESINTSTQAFNNLERDDTKMLSATIQAILANKEIVQTFGARDKERLYSIASPVFNELKNKYGITHWYFHNPEWDPKVFLRVHKKDQSGDEIKRVTYWNAVRTKDFAAGTELGKTAFALRVVHPVFQNGKLIGYVELGEEIDHFFKAMKEQTGNDFAVIVNKKYLDEKEWASARAAQGERNNWGDNKDVVMVDKTTNEEHLAEYDGDLSQVPAKGVVLEEFKKGSSVFMRGIFPLLDAAGLKVGGVFVVKDITPLYKEMAVMRNLLIGFVILLMVIISVYIVFLTNKLVFSRLNRIIDTATMVVGGAFNQEIKVSADDEIGKFEALFEQFRKVFVDVVKEQYKIFK